MFGSIDAKKRQDAAFLFAISNYRQHAAGRFLADALTLRVAKDRTGRLPMHHEPAVDINRLSRDMGRSSGA